MAQEINLPPFPPATFQSRMTEWFRPVAMRESGVVFFPVRMDRLRRMTQFLRDTTLQKKLFSDQESIRWVTVSSAFLATPFNEVEFLKQIGLSSLYLKDNKIQFVLVVTDAEYLYEANHEWAVSILNDLAYKYRNISVVQLLEQNILQTTHGDVIRKYASLFNHIAYAPLYNEKEILHFAQYLCQYFRLNRKIDAKEWTKIYQTCGGHPWLVKEVIRFFSLHSNANIDSALAHEELFRMVDVIWEGMLPNEQTAIRSIARGYSDVVEDMESLAFLKKLRLIQQGGGKTYCMIKLLCVRARNDAVRQTLVVGTDGSLRSNGVVITDYFSGNERATLVHLHKTTGEIASRDMVGKAGWGEEGFTDWALDRLTSRIRKKLTRLGYPEDYLQTIPGKGFRVKHL